MTDFDHKRFKELSKIIDAKVYIGCCYYPCGAHCFTKVTFKPEYNFEGHFTNDKDEEQYKDINELLKKTTFEFIRIDSSREEDGDLLYVPVDLYVNNDIQVTVKLLITEELYDEIQQNCASYDKKKKTTKKDKNVYAALDLNNYG
jgi:hypothetical protein